MNTDKNANNGGADTVRDAAFWLAVEEYLMEAPPAASAADERRLIVWQTPPYIVLGANQVAEAEIDVAAAERLGCGVTRRRSGGGAIYQDYGSVQYTVIQPFERGEAAFLTGRGLLMASVARALNRLGVPAVAEGRNDVTVDGMKVSGLSQFALGERLLIHGAMLYDSDIDNLASVLKPDPGKIATKAVRSVRSRVANVSRHFNGRPASEFVDAFRDALRADWAERGTPLADVCLSSADCVKINEIRARKYANRDWVFGASPPFTFRAQRRFSHGAIDFYADVRGGVVASCAIRGDFLGLLPIAGFEGALTGVAFRRADFAGTLATLDARLYIGGITKDEFLSCVFE